MKIIIAVVLSAAFIWLQPSPLQLNNSAAQFKKTKAVQVESPRKVATDATLAVQEKTPMEPQPVAETIVLTPHESLMQQAGIPESDWNAVDYIVRHESSWNSSAQNTESGAYGLCQALPSWKMASAGTDYMSNPVTQLKWCHDYASHRYGGWWSSFAFWRSNKWW